MNRLVAMGLASAFAVASQAEIVEYWDFEDTESVVGPFTAEGDANGSGYSEGLNGTLMHGWSSSGGLQYGTRELGAVGGNYVATSDNQDGYVYNETASAPLMEWSFSSWIVQMHLRIDDMDGWETVMAKMGSSWSVNESDFYLQRRGDQGDAGVMRLNYQTSDGTRTVLDGTTALVAGKWYGVAVVADDADSISLYLDQGNGYVLDGQLAGQTQGLAETASSLDWSFFRDYYGGKAWDNTDGAMDNLQINDTALDISELTVIPEPATIGLMGLAGCSSLVVVRDAKQFVWIVKERRARARLSCVLKMV